MKYEKVITINLGNYESLKIGVGDAPSFEECDRALTEHCKSMGIEVDQKIMQALEWAEDGEV